MALALAAACACAAWLRATARPSAGEIEEHARSLFLSGDVDGAIDLLRRDLETERARSRNGHATAERASRLARVLQSARHFDEAERLYREALERDRAALGPTHAEVARHAFRLAYLLRKRGRLDEASALFGEARAIAETAALTAAELATIRTFDAAQCMRSPAPGANPEENR